MNIKRLLIGVLILASGGMASVAHAATFNYLGGTDAQPNPGSGTTVYAWPSGTPYTTIANSVGALALTKAQAATMCANALSTYELDPNQNYWCNFVQVSRIKCPPKTGVCFPTDTDYQAAISTVAPVSVVDSSQPVDPADSYNIQPQVSGSLAAFPSLYMYVSPSNASSFTFPTPGGGLNWLFGYVGTVTPVPTATLTASPTSVVQGGNSTLTWSSANATSCTGTNFSTGGATSGSVIVTPGTTTTYLLDCSGAGGNAPQQSTTVTVTALPPNVSAGPSTDVNVALNQTVTLSALITNASGAGTAGSFPNVVEITPCPRAQAFVRCFGGQNSIISAQTITSLAPGASQTVTANFTPSSDAEIAGVYFYHFCANTDTNQNQPMNEVSKTDDCPTTWNKITIVGPNITVSSTIYPPTINATLGQPIPLTGTILNNGTADTPSTFPNLFVTNLNTQGTAWNTLVQTSPNSPILAVNNSEDTSVVLPGSTFSAPGRYQYAYCGDETTTWANAFAESDTGDNCSNQGTIVVTTPPTATLTATVAVVAPGGSSTLNWSSQYANTCTGTNFSTGSATSGNVSVTPGVDTTYSITCDGDGGSVTKTTTVRVATLACTPSPSAVDPNAPVTWTATANNFTPPLTYTWSAPGGVPSNGSGSQLTNRYANSGAQSPTVTVRDSKGVVINNQPCSSVTVNGQCGFSGTASLSAKPDTINPGGSSTLAYAGGGFSPPGTGSCTITGSDGSSYPTTNADNLCQTSGTQQVGPLSNRTVYKITCTNTATASATVNVTPAYKEF
jgi:hypothetical protein